MLANIGTAEIVAVAIVLLVLFGGKKIPEFVRGLAEAMKEFQKASKDDDTKGIEEEKREADTSQN